ncbi:MAG: SMP-30/gluconolactonase/LRE family protein, partial [Clostridia bacterium]|nr:SMP-30/gluconolactonase/LRE family protein [Clostridia bacterium]
MKKSSRMMIRFVTLSLVFVLAFSAYAMPASAAVSYDTYTYDTYSTARVSPDGYQVTKVINGVDIGVGNMSSPKDIFVRNDHIYILDSGNGRIIVTDFDFNLVKTIDHFYEADGTEYTLHDPNGFFIDTDEKHIYIADTNNETLTVYDDEGNIVFNPDGTKQEITVGNKVICVDEAGVIVSEFNKPESDI